ncbi:DUF6366 family protein [Paenibacillus sp. MABNR03]|uniref:Phage capsid protein n=2 Tax=Paenibacillus TaxID=44249 RepID=A0A7Y6EU62_9BACL|nr:hypothetical protein [Paenibacillus xylanilyticus]
MNTDQETPERKRERLRQEELQENAVGTFKDGLDRAQFGNLSELVGSLGWIGTGVVIVVIITVFMWLK